VDTGAIGNLLHVDGFFSFDNRDPENIRNKPETGGGGIRDIGVYTYGSTRFVTGAEPKSVDARIRYENGVDVVAEVSADFGDFRHRSVVSTRMFPRQHMTFHGDEGFFTLTAPFNAGHIRAGPDRDTSARAGGPDGKIPRGASVQVAGREFLQLGADRCRLSLSARVFVRDAGYDRYGLCGWRSFLGLRYGMKIAAEGCDMSR